MADSRSESELVALRGGVMIPAGAIIAVLNLERAGHRLTLDPDHEHINVEPAPGVTVDQHDLDQLRRWKQHAIRFMSYVPDTSHLFTDKAGVA